MKNPWEEISLTDYENHMKLDSVMQLQSMNEMMKGQFNAYPETSCQGLFNQIHKKTKKKVPEALPCS